ncbi:MAG: M3 family metallopeptidase [Beijerinckiaceae bacterium]|jgi:peptidyl-dipeptidase Dcp|nr:M3 family metallopeptidase [Beijerinckiaceae bacterium]
MTHENPLLSPQWDTPYGLPPFSKIQPGHFAPAFEEAFARHLDEIKAIASNSAGPGFANTIAAFEQAGALLTRTSHIFFNLTGANTSEELQAIERDLAPKFAQHRSTVYMNPVLFARIDHVWQHRENAGLDAEQSRVTELIRKDFIRTGAQLDEAGRARLAHIMKEQASLTTAFSQNVLKDEASFTLVLETEDDLAGLPQSLIASAKETAIERGMADKHVLTTTRSHADPFLQFSGRRELREAMFNAWTRRGDTGGDTDNNAIIARIIALRAERAKLLGYDSFADYKLDNTMAKTAANVHELVDAVWEAGRKKALEERDALQAIASSEGGNFSIARHDWRYYTEKLRKQRFALDEDELKPYFEREQVRAAAFHVAGKLFGLSFEEVKGLDLQHADARAFDVKDTDGNHIALFIADDFARPTKHSGAWMSAFRRQQKLGGDIRPIIVNTQNFNKPPAGQPSLLSLEEARTLFHEFGHALHGMLSDVTYPRISGTSVSTDFVELPSQLYEHWLLTPEVLRTFARHYETGDLIPEELVEKVQAMRSFNQGFMSVEYCASTLVDMDLHEMSREDIGAPEDFDARAFERTSLERIGMPGEITMRHRTPHFSHIFSGDGYAAGYYSYLWSEVLDADAFSAFEETGDVFDPELAAKLKQYIYSAGGRQEPDQAYIAFRGALPAPNALMRKRGLV